jgi:hypothetical protein
MVLPDFAAGIFQLLDIATQAISPDQRASDA